MLSTLTTILSNPSRIIYIKGSPIVYNTLIYLGLHSFALSHGFNSLNEYNYFIKIFMPISGTHKTLFTDIPFSLKTPISALETYESMSFREFIKLYIQVFRS